LRCRPPHPRWRFYVSCAGPWLLGSLGCLLSTIYNTSYCWLSSLLIVSVCMDPAIDCLCFFPSSRCSLGLDLYHLVLPPPSPTHPPPKARASEHSPTLVFPTSSLFLAGSSSIPPFALALFQCSVAFMHRLSAAWHTLSTVALVPFLFFLFWRSSRGGRFFREVLLRCCLGGVQPSSAASLSDFVAFVPRGERLAGCPRSPLLFSAFPPPAWPQSTTRLSIRAKWCSPSSIDACPLWGRI